MIITGTCAVLAGCADLAPVYSRPALAIPVLAPPRAENEQTLPLWEDFFCDAHLRASIALALTHNRDLRIAALQIEAARLQHDNQRARQFPTLAAEASANQTRGSGANASAYFSGLNLSLSEVDFFGNLKNQTLAAQHALLATQEGQRQVYISLIAATATAWLRLAGDQRAIQLETQTLASLRVSLELTQRMEALGAITRLALYQAQSAYDSAVIRLMEAQTRARTDLNALETLLGTRLPPALRPDAQTLERADHALLLDVPGEVPSGLLRRRPDLMQAEHVLQASHADLGSARAARFPSIALTSSQGLGSAALGGVLRAGAAVWSQGASLSLPVLDGGISQNNVRAAEVRIDIALAQYDQAVQRAFQEVADSLALRARLAERLDAQARLNTSARQQLTLAQAQFKAGGATMLDVLDAQRTDYQAQQQTLALRLTELDNRISLYKVLGGGWPSTFSP